MQACLMLILAAMIGPDGNAGQATRSPSQPDPSASAPTAGAGSPHVAFEVRQLRFGGPEWRGKLLPKLQEISRQEGTTVWAVDESALKELVEICQSDARSNLIAAPTMVGPVGRPARMTNEETVKYVASLKRKADGAPGQATSIAFEPQVGEVHTGVRVNVESSQLKGNVLFARLVINENRLLKMHTTQYTEGVINKDVAQTHEGKGPLQDLLHRNVGQERQSINATVQIPEVETRHAEGEWLIPSTGALVVSMGPRSRAAGLRTQYEEHVIAITARPAYPSIDARIQRTSGAHKVR